MIPADTRWDVKDFSDAEPLHIMENAEVAKMVLQRALDMNYTYESVYDGTAINNATIKGNTAIVKVLVQFGARISILKAEDPLNCLLQAAFYGHVSVFRALLEARAPEDSWKEVPQDRLLYDSICSKSAEMLKAVLQLGLDVDILNQSGFTALYFAAYTGQTDMLDMLLQAKADANGRAGQRWAPLHGAAYKGHSEIVRGLLKAGALVDTKSQGVTSLHMAVKAGHSAVAKALLAAGAQPDATDERGRTTLHYAAQHCQCTMARLLIEAGANINAQSISGETALYIACDWSDQCTRQERVELLNALLDNDAENPKADANKADQTGTTALHICFHRCDVDLAKALLASGGDPTLLDGYGKSCIDWADLYQPLRQAISPWLEIYQTPDEVQRQQCRFVSVVKLCRCLKERKLSIEINNLGRCFISLNELENASIAFQQLVSAEKNHRRSCYCDGCSEGPIRGQSFVCKSCADRDLCKSCMEKYLGDSTTIEGCVGHDVLEIPGPTWAKLRENCVNEAGESWEEWLSRMLTTYEKKLDRESIVNAVTSVERSRRSNDFNTQRLFNLMI